MCEVSVKCGYHCETFIHLKLKYLSINYCQQESALEVNFVDWAKTMKSIPLSG